LSRIFAKDKRLSRAVGKSETCDGFDGITPEKKRRILFGGVTSAQFERCKKQKTKKKKKMPRVSRASFL